MDKDLFLQRVLDAEDTLFHVSFSILHNEQDCADAVQEAILKAYKQREQLRNEQFFRTWLVRITINECYAMLRRHKHFQSYEEANTEANMEAIDHTRSFIQEEYLDLYQAITKLEEKQRICIILFYFEDYSVAEIAQILRLPSGTVKSRLNRARQVLKGLLKEENEQGVAI